jgi:hypothetical protein
VYQFIRYGTDYETLISVARIVMAESSRRQGTTRWSDGTGIVRTLGGTEQSMFGYPGHATSNSKQLEP